MLLFFLACLTSGEVSKSGEIELHISGGSIYACHDVSEASQESSLKLATTLEGEVIGHGSGNYFKMGSHRFILTAAHVVTTEYDLRVLDGDKMIETTLVFVDIERDIAILVPKEDLETVKPRRWMVNDDTPVGEIVSYSGYPAGLGKVLIRGMVSAPSEDGFIMQSFALPGSSGSVVFDNRGRVLGVVSAVMLNHSGLSPFPNLEENVVYVSSAGYMDSKFIREVLRCGIK